MGVINEFGLRYSFSLPMTRDMDPKYAASSKNGKRFYGIFALNTEFIYHMTAEIKIRKMLARKSFPFLLLAAYFGPYLGSWV